MKDQLDSQEFHSILTNCENAENEQYSQVLENRSVLKRFIRSHFTAKIPVEMPTTGNASDTPKTVEKKHYLVLSDGDKIGEVIHMNQLLRGEEVNIIFAGTQSECEEEKKRLESLDKLKEVSHYGLFKSENGTVSIVGRNLSLHQECFFYGTHDECKSEKKRLESIAKGGEEEDKQCACGSFSRAECKRGDGECPKPTPNSGNYRSELLTVATAAMNGMLANSIDKDQGVEPFWYMQPDRVAKYALEYGKSLITAIDKEVQSNT